MSPPGPILLFSSVLALQDLQVTALAITSITSSSSENQACSTDVSLCSKKEGVEAMVSTIYSILLSKLPGLQTVPWGMEAFENRDGDENSTVECFLGSRNTENWLDQSGRK